MSKELLSKIKWTCTFSNVKPKVYNGTLRIVQHINLAYVDTYRVIIKDSLYLFFNKQDYFYIKHLRPTTFNKNKYTKYAVYIDIYTSKWYTISN